MLKLLETFYMAEDTIKQKVRELLSLPTDYQKDIYAQRITDQAIDEANHLNSQLVVPGSERPEMSKNMIDGQTSLDADNLIIDGQQVMQSWQTSLMKAVADAAEPEGKNILEIGYGLGIASQYVQSYKPEKHTIIECNPTVYANLVQWAKQYENIYPVKGLWQDILPTLDRYDSILFDPYPFDENEFQQHWLQDGNFAAHFFPHAAKHLHPGGTFTYFSNEIDSLSRRHQRQLLQHFSRIEIRIVKDLAPPPECQYWWASSMIVVKAIK